MSLGKNIKLFLAEIRIYQWTKNTLIFLPLIISHEFSLDIISNNFVAFFAFSLIASGVYVFNDIKDVDKDKLHPSKKKRPLAAGDISFHTALYLCALLLISGILLSISISSLFLGIVLIYILMNLLYTLHFKNYIIIDVIFLTSFYTIRLLCGHITSNVYPSIWLISFSIFFFFGLSLLKRYIDIKMVDGGKGSYKKYKSDDLYVISSLGIGSGLVSVLVFIMYTGSEKVQQYFESPLLLLAMVPGFFYWISRIWFFANRGKINIDPVMHTIKDRATYVLILYFLIVFYLSSIELEFSF